MNRLKSIIVGVDFSACSRNALLQALRIAEYNGAKLRVVHVIQPSLTTDIAEAYAISQVDRWDDLRRMTQERMESLVATVRRRNSPVNRIRGRSAEVEVDVLLGNQFVHLLREVRDFDAELLVLGSNGSSSPAGGPGGLARQCLHKAPVRVLLVSPESSRPFERITACVGFSDLSRDVVAEAIHMARQEEAVLHVFHLCESANPVAVTAGGPEEADGVDAGALRERQARALRAFLPPFAADMRGLEIDVCMSDRERRTMDLSEQIRSDASDLVVVGTRGRTDMKESLDETAAERILRRSGSSVLAVKPAGFRYEVGGACRRR